MERAKSKDKQVTVTQGAPAIMRHAMPRFGLNESDIGQLIHTDNKCQGILLAPQFQHVATYGKPKVFTLTPRGKKFGPIFDYFMASQDTRFLTKDRPEERATYTEEIQRIADLEVHGHKGSLFQNDVEIYQAASRNPKKLAGWHMPVLALICGIDPINRAKSNKNPNNMVEHMANDRLGSFSPILASLKDPSSGGPGCYFTASKNPNNINKISKHFVFAVDLSKQYAFWVDRTTLGSSRPVRGVVRPTP